MTDPAFPPIHVYALAHICPTCRALPGQPCDAPRKKAAADRVPRSRARLGVPPVEADPLSLMHVTRSDAGYRHYQRDFGNAPWTEDRVPGRRYDTLPRTA